MSNQKENIYKAIEDLLQNSPQELDNLGQFINLIEGYLTTIDEPGFDPYNNPIYKRWWDLEELYAVKLDENQPLNTSDLEYIKQLIDEMKSELKLLI
ncbi:MAG TPA: hypothetical protein VL401_00085 [Alphaproteobacteria bacterium]|jgi:hypothetical protein|nr:hypothetical protein [Alphaproteobacteria bacterium]